MYLEKSREKNKEKTDVVENGEINMRNLALYESLSHATLTHNSSLPTFFTWER